MNARHYDFNKLERLVKESGMLRSELAERCGVKPLAITRATKGKIVSYTLLARIMQELGHDVVEVLYPRPLSKIG